MYQDYINKRKDLFDKKETDLFDHWPLYVGEYSFSNMISKLDILDKTIDIPGDILEFGCWKGTNLMFISKYLKVKYPHIHKRIYGFDLFDQGLDFFDPKDLDAVKFKGEYSGDIEKLKKLIELFQYEERIKLIKGNIMDTLPTFLDENEFKRYSLVFLDTDLYTSTKLILDKVFERVVKGGILAFDEWNFDTYPGETTAFNEFMESNSDKVELISNKISRQPSLMMKKII